MNRREFLKHVGQTAGYAAMASAGVPAAAGELQKKPKAKLRCRPTISGALWGLDPDSAQWDISRWRDELEEQRKIGFDLLWLCLGDVRSGPDFLGEPFKRLMDLCAKRKVQVILDAGSTSQWWSPMDLDNELRLCGENVRKIGEHYAGHPAFYAWYIHQEINIRRDRKDEDYIEALFSGLVERCKKAADLPVTISPFFILDRDKVFGDFGPFTEPDEYGRYWEKLIRRAGLDIVMLQDSGEHFSYVTMEQRRPFFEAMSQACRDSGTKLWGNVESAEYVCDSIEEYVKLYGRVHHSLAKGLPWRAVPIDRMRQKLELAAEYSERIVNWGYREYCRPALCPEAKQWYDDYRRYYAEVRKNV